MTTHLTDNEDHTPQDVLEPMLNITWRRGPNLPQGFQDSDGGCLGNILITVGGFCSGKGNEIKAGRYPRGFLKKVWALDLSAGRPEWVTLPDFPGAARQELFCIPVGEALYCWGGFSYASPFCYRDGYQLSQKDGQWVWEALPPLLWPISIAGISAIDSKIYVMGGADYDLNRFSTWNDCEGKNPRLGAHLLVLDTDDVQAGWNQLADCPGTPRMVHAMAAVRGNIYVIGGATGDHPQAVGGQYSSGKEMPSYCTVVDNWRYAPANGQWIRIRDLPISSGNFPAGNITFTDRYILLIGGFQYSKVATPDGTLREPYGQPSRFEGRSNYYNDVFVYDTQSDLFGTADTLPLNNNLPMTVVRGDEIFLIGGETGGAIVEGEQYGHHPDLFLRGQIQER